MARYPYCDGDVVRCSAIVDGQEAMNTEEELFATVVIGCIGETNGSDKRSVVGRIVLGYVTEL